MFIRPTFLHPDTRLAIPFSDNWYLKNEIKIISNNSLSLIIALNIKAGILT